MERSYTTSFLSSRTPRRVFEAVSNVRAWWTAEVDGRPVRVGSEFEVRFGGVHRSRLKVMDALPFRRIVWLVTDSWLSFPADKQAWTGTRLCFDIARRGLRTQLRFTHLGLTPGMECFDACAGAWNLYIRASLRRLSAPAAGAPEARERRWWERDFNSKPPGPGSLGRFDGYAPRG